MVRDRLRLTAGLPSTRPTTSAWQEPPASIAATQSATLPPVSDVVIIGSGVTGTSVANTLLSHPAAPKLRVTILEARTACSGATGRNGGHLVSDICDRFEELVTALGVEEAVKILRFSEANISELRAVVAKLDESEQDAVELREVNATCTISDKETLDDIRRSMELFHSTVEKTDLEYAITQDQDAMVSV